MWGKTLNSGQTCIAPDYVVAIGLSEAQVTLFTQHCKSALQTIYKTLDGLSECKEYTRIINSTHFARLSTLLDAQKKIKGVRVETIGTPSPSSLFFPPTLITNLSSVPSENPIMTQEIFGPILPIIRVPDLPSALALVESTSSTPLALYIFSSEPSTISTLKSGINSGGVVLNDVIIHCAVEGLPFGGVKSSGLGVYHGPHNFTTFTRPKSVLVRWRDVDVFSAPRYMWFLGEWEGSIVKGIKAVMEIGNPSERVLMMWEIWRLVGGWDGVKGMLLFLVGVYLGSRFL